jgi:hypothetical protein
MAALVGMLPLFGQGGGGITSSGTVVTQRFHNGQALKVEGAVITIRDPRSASGPCARIGADGVINAAQCAATGPGFFQVHLTDYAPPEVDYIEIVVGTPRHIEGITGEVMHFGEVLHFETFTSPIYPGIDTAVGTIEDLGAIRTIRVRLLKNKAEGMFR